MWQFIEWCVCNWIIKWCYTTCNPNYFTQLCTSYKFTWCIFVTHLRSRFSSLLNCHLAIRYSTVYLRALNSWRDDQPNLVHGTEMEKIRKKRRNGLWRSVKHVYHDFVLVFLYRLYSRLHLAYNLPFGVRGAKLGGGACLENWQLIFIWFLCHMVPRWCKSAMSWVFWYLPPTRQGAPPNVPYIYFLFRPTLHFRVQPRLDCHRSDCPRSDCPRSTPTAPSLKAVWEEELIGTYCWLQASDLLWSHCEVICHT